MTQHLSELWNRWGKLLCSHKQHTLTTLTQHMLLTEDILSPYVLLFTSHIQKNRLDELCCLQLDEKTKGIFLPPNTSSHDIPKHQNPLDGSKLPWQSRWEMHVCSWTQQSQSSYAGQREPRTTRHVTEWKVQRGTGWALTAGGGILHAPQLLPHTARPHSPSLPCNAWLAPLHWNTGPDTLLDVT